GLFPLSRLASDGAVTNFTFDRRRGQPTIIAGPDSQTTRFAYDAQGRLRSVVLPGDSLALPSRLYTYEDSVLPSAVRTFSRPVAESPELIQSISYFDGSENVFQKRTAASGGKYIVSGNATRNGTGTVAQEFEPFFDGSITYSPPDLGGVPSRR